MVSVHPTAPLTRYENRDWSVSVVAFPEAVRRTGSAFMSSSLRVFVLLFSLHLHLPLTLAHRQNERILAALSPACAPAEVHPLCRWRIQGGRLNLMSGRPDIWREGEGTFGVGGRMELSLF